MILQSQLRLWQWGYQMWVKTSPYLLINLSVILGFPACVCESSQVREKPLWDTKEKHAIVLLLRHLGSSLNIQHKRTLFPRHEREQLHEGILAT